MSVVSLPFITFASMSVALNVVTAAALVVLALRHRKRNDDDAEPPQQWPTLSD